jgi:hypothetical protein
MPFPAGLTEAGHVGHLDDTASWPHAWRNSPMSTLLRTLLLVALAGGLLSACTLNLPTNTSEQEMDAG